MDDLISRQAAINRIKKQIEVSVQDRPPMISKEMRDNWDENAKRAKAHYELAIEMLERLPAADPVKRGRWIYGQDFHWYTAHCSLCGYERKTDVKAKKWNMWGYCPNCGAKMDGE